MPSAPSTFTAEDFVKLTRLDVVTMELLLAFEKRADGKPVSVAVYRERNTGRGVQYDRDGKRYRIAPNVLADWGAWIPLS